MGTEQRYSDYDSFAWFSDRYWGEDFISRALPVMDKLLLQGLPKGARILDLCCGTGQLAHLLAERGFRVLGIDGSEEMLRYARTNAPSAEFMLADARSLSLPPLHHAAVSTFDSLNHVMELRELREVFRNVHNALAEDGRFIFDLNMEEGYRTRWRGTYAIVEPDNVCIVRAAYDAERRLGRNDITMFREEAGGWRRSDMTLIQKCYPEEEVRAALEESGFTDVQALDAAEDLGMQGAVGRWFFLARKGAGGVAGGG
jgi:SAM-dependent methyltransferase